MPEKETSVDAFMANLACRHCGLCEMSPLFDDAIFKKQYDHKCSDCKKITVYILRFNNTAEDRSASTE